MVAATHSIDAPVRWRGRALWSTLIVIGAPISSIVLLSTQLEIEIPGALLYAIGAILGLLLLRSTIYNVEWLLAAVVIYLPLSKIMPAIVAPGLNGVNILLILMLVAWGSAVQTGSCSFIKGIPYGRVMVLFGLVSSLSVLTLMQDPIGKQFFAEEGITEFKGWLDQFVLFFGFANLISGRAMARRIVIYCLVGSVVAQSFGVLEMFAKQGEGTIEDARVLGPVLQPNNFGAFIVYNLSPVIAFAVLNYRKWYVLLLVPYFFLSLKLLLATFSRGAFVGIAAAGVTAAFFRGLFFFLLAVCLGLVIVIKYPDLVPDAIKDRMGSTTGGYYSVTYDESANSRLVLWEAAAEMTAESPLTGKGYLAFQLLKSQYTDVSVTESDPHNMYLYISSQMGVPALILFLTMLYGFFRCSYRVFRHANDEFSKVVGLGGLTMIAGVVTINMFGTRMINAEVSGYFWIYFAVLVNMLREVDGRTRRIVKANDRTDLNDIATGTTMSRQKSTRPASRSSSNEAKMRYSVIS